MHGLGDLQLAAAGRRELPDGLVHRGGEDVDADERQVALRVHRLFVKADHLARIIKLGHPELARIWHRGEQDLRVRPRRHELVDQPGNAADDEIVAEVHYKVVVAEEITGDQHGVREPERGPLPDIGDVQPELAAVADRCPYRRRGVTHHDPHVSDAGIGDGLEAVEQNGLIGHREQLFCRRMGNRPESAPGSACQH